MAKTPGKIRGTVILVDINGETIGCSTNATLTITNNGEVATCKDDDGAETEVPTTQGWELQLDGLVKYEGGAASNFSVLAALAVNKNVFTWAMQSDNPEDPVFSSSGWIGTFQYAAPMAPATWAVTVRPAAKIVLSNT